MINRTVLICFLIPSVAFAQKRPFDKQLWSSLQIECNEIKKLQLGISYQSRFDSNIERFKGSYLTAEAAYKFGKGIRLLGAIRGASSARWDKLRFSTGLSKNIKLGKHTELKLRALWQYQVFSGTDVRYGIEIPQQNYRFRLAINQKIAPKTCLTLQTEPLWRKELQEVNLNRIRTSLLFQRSLPGPWSVSLGYMNQLGFNRSSSVHALLVGLMYELKFKSKVKE